jgi:peptidoglycan/LPS O-acetylase OafA/YrhL
MLGKRLSFLGNISYSVDVIHFPLQLLFAIAARTFSIPSACFYSPRGVALF